MRPLKIWLLIFALTIIFYVPKATCEEKIDSKELKVIKGKIVSLDLQGSLISIRWFNNEDKRYDELTFAIPDETDIIKQGQDVAISELNKGNQVTVEYYDGDFMGLETTRITIEPNE